MLKEFSILVEGLIPCAALHSIAAVREQTHGLLALMNKSLDGAFCAHRALIPDPDDSIDYILNLISQEISTKILYDDKARNILDTDSLKSWYDRLAIPDNDYPLDKETLWQYLDKGGANLSDIRKQRAKNWLKKRKSSKNPVKNNNGKKISYIKAETFIEKGLFQEIEDCIPPSDKKPGKFSELFYPTQKESEIACNEFARLSSTSKDGAALRMSTNAKMFLKLGSVLKVNNDVNKYWLCLQPPCDSVRLVKETEMLFLHLYKGDKENTDFVIKLQDGTYKALAIKSGDKKPRLMTHGFSQDKDSRRILISKLNPEFQWVADLRPEKALSIAQQVLTNASRIGMDEFEILRRKGSQL